MLQMCIFNPPLMCRDPVHTCAVTQFAGRHRGHSAAAGNDKTRMMH